MPKSATLGLLGDAIHAMTPTLGRGANIAMRDGATLDFILKMSFRGRTLPEAICEYETEMTRYGFDIVEDE